MYEQKSEGSYCLGALAWTLALVFAVLKWAGVIGWSWLWVLSPLWIVYGFALAVLLVGIAALAVTALLNSLFNPD